MYAPLRRLFCPLVFVMSEFCYEVCDNLTFDGSLQAVLDVKLAQFYGPSASHPGLLITRCRGLSVRTTTI